MDRMKSIFVILLCICMMATGCAEPVEPVVETPEPTVENPTAELEETVTEIVEATKWRGAFLVSPLELAASDQDETGVAIDSGFAFSGLEAGTDVTARLKFEPEVAFDTYWPDNAKAVIQPQAPLASGQVYKITYTSAEGTQSWAFQTQDEFSLKRSIPRHQAVDVPVDAAVEWVFNRMDLEDIRDYVTIEPAIAGGWQFYRGTWTFLPEKLEAGTMYTFTLSGDYATDDGEILGEPVIMSFTTTAQTERPDTWMVFDSYYHEKPDAGWLLSVSGRGFDPGETFPVRIERYPDLDDFLADIETQHAFVPWGSNPIRKWVADEQLEPAEETVGTIIGSTSKGSQFYLSIPDGLPQGNYRLTTEIDGVTTRTLVQVHPLNAMVQTTDQEIVFWAVDPETGAGMENLLVQTGDEIRQTDAEGTAIFRMAVGSDPFVVFAKEEGKQPLVLALPQAWETFNGWYWSGYYSNPDYYTTLFTDRGLYQPTDRIEGWGVLRAKDERSLDRLTVSLETWSEEASVLATQKVEVDEAGTFVFDFDIKELLPQTYRIRVYEGETLVMARTIDVGRYVKPELIVNVETDKQYYESGETVEVDVSCNFFDGSPAVGTELEVTYHDTAYHRESLKVDKNGQAKLSLVPQVDAPTINGQSIDIYVRTKDEQNKEVTDYAYIQVFPRDVWIQLDTEIEDGRANVAIANYKLDLTKANSPDRTGDVSDYWGDPIDLDLHIDVVEVYWEQTSVMKQYDPIERRMIEIPQYTKRERPVTRFDFNQIEGGSFEFQVEPHKSYKVQVLTEDQQGRSVQVTKSVRDYYWGRPDPNSPYIELRKPDWSTEYSIGETVSLTLTRGDAPVESLADNAKLLLVVYQNGIREIRSYGTPIAEFTFRESDLPNLYVQALYYDGRQILRSRPTVVSYKESDRELTIQAETNQDRYAPGDMATVDFVVTDPEGNPVKANLYLAVVDEAFFAVRNQVADPLRELYRDMGYPNLTRSTASTDGGAYNLFGGAEGGGEGDSIAIRSDFRDTAVVRDLITDANGRAQFSFVLPDNLTTWRLTSLGVTDELMAGAETAPIEVGLPFFLQTIGADEFLTGDMPMMGYRVYGAKAGESVTHRLKLSQNGEVIYETDQEGEAGQISYLAMPELKTGTYTVTMTSETANASDGIEKNIEVLDARNAAWVDFEYQPGDLFLYPYGELTILPAEQGWLYREWRQLLYTRSRRVDAAQAKRLSQIQINRWMEEKMDVAEPPYEFQQYNGGFGLVAYGEADPVLTAKLVASGLPETMTAKALNYLNRLAEEATDEVDTAAALWGLASQGEPVLTALQAAEPVFEDDEARLYLALGFAALGAEEEAMGIYEPMMRERAYTFGDRTYLYSGDINQQRIDTMLAALVAIQLDRPEAMELYAFARDLPPMKELNRLERALFLQHFKVDPTVEGRVEAVTPVKTIDKAIDVDEMVTYMMSAEELADTDWRTVEHVDMSLSAYIPVKELYEPQNGLLGLNRTYLVLGKTLEDATVGDVVQVRLRLQLDKNAPKGGYVISDVLPSNLRFMDATKRYDDEYWIDNTGQQVTIHTWPVGKALEVTVLARVVAPGTYQAEPAFVQARQHYGQLNTDLFGFSEAQVIEVKADETDSPAE